jgi:hypothetical protein
VEEKREAQDLDIKYKSWEASQLTTKVQHLSLYLLLQIPVLILEAIFDFQAVNTFLAVKVTKQTISDMYGG